MRVDLEASIIDASLGRPQSQTCSAS